MKRFAILCVLACSLSLTTRAATITVNSTDPTTTPPAGQTNLWLAMTLLHDGATIQFNIPGAGPHYLETPSVGYAWISNNNVTIDGYTQPGAVPNTNPILARNNAQIKIVLSSTNGNFTDLGYEPANTGAGYGPGEGAVLGIFNATNVTLRGLCFLGAAPVNQTFDAVGIARNYSGGAVGLGNAAHINGCWIGVDVDGTNVHGFNHGISAPRHSDAAIGNAARLPSNRHVIGVKAGAANPRAQFNVIVGATINVILEGQAHRVSGNFLGVLPSGTNDFIPPLAYPGAMIAESQIEIGRGASDVVIGTDGDGVNDADERNILGGMLTDGATGGNQLGGYRHLIELYSLSSSPGEDRQRVRVAGNYVCVGVDGVTRFTNATAMLNGSSVAGTHYWIGSDFDGVSDDIEPNLFYGNYPGTPGLFFATGYTNSVRSGSGSQGFFDEPDPNAGGFSVRGNQVVNNYPYPFNPRRGGNFQNLTNYIKKALTVPLPATVEAYYPVIAASSTTGNLIGTAPANNATYPWLIIDVYRPDPEGLTNGLVVADPYLTNGWVHGRTYLGSFVDNGPYDLNPSAGAFNFSICSLGLSAGTQITISANYSKDAPGTHNARILTSLFSPPVTLGAGNCLLVTTAASSGPGSLSNALYSVADGGYIGFNIPGAGPHYIETPAGGHPLIIKDNVILDGYSQPGARANTNSINGSNTAVIKIVLDSRNGSYRDMEYTLFTPANSSPPIDNSSMVNERGGYGFPERAILGIYRATNVNVRGLAFLGDGTDGYSIAVAHDYGLDTSVKDRLAYDEGSTRNCHINGCFFGINPTNPTPAGLALDGAAIAFFRHRDVSGGPRPELANESLIVGVKPGSGSPRGEFNVFAYQNGYALAGEAIRTRFSGNFLGVMPDGVTPSGSPLSMDDGIEIGRYDDTEPMIFGTDGDGVNDAEEGNLFGPLDGTTAEGDVLGFYSMGNKLYIVAGNRFGIGVNGTRWTNSQSIFGDGNIASTAKVQFGSDFDGVSDAAEANVVYNNYPFSTLYPTPNTTVPTKAIGADAGARVSVRGNQFINNDLVPYSYADGAGGRLTGFTNYEAPYFETASPIIPILSPKSSSAQLLGTAAKAVGIFTNVIVDVYIADPEGWTNGMKFEFFELSNGAGGFHGFPQGKTYKGSASLGNNFPGGGFLIDVASMGLTVGDVVTVCANYSGDPPGTHRGRTHTSNFANPVTLLAPIRITSITRSGSTLTFTWTGGAPPYILQKRSPITGAWSNVTTGIAGTSTTDTITGTEGYYRIVDP